MMRDTKLGLSTGCLHMLFDRSELSGSIKLIAQSHICALEILCRRFNDLSYLSQVGTKCLKSFDYISLHAPVKNFYQKDNATTVFLDQLVTTHRKFKFDHVILHPDKMQNWDILKQYGQIPWSIENMDQKKDFGIDTDDLEGMMDRGPELGFVLDLQHCFTNDSSMEIVDEYLDRFGDRLVEIHLSGYNINLVHCPLYLADQEVIIQKLSEVLRYKNVPIIIESTFLKLEEIQKEINYVQSYLQSF